MVVCAHNEEYYVQDCLESILRQTVQPSLIIVVADKCTDRTVETARRILRDSSYLVIEKTENRWKNSISENLELARGKATGGAFAIVDADMTIPPDYLERLLLQLGEYSSVSAVAKTDPARGLVNRLVSFWERTYRVTPLGQQPRGGVRAISRQALDTSGGFRDVIAWDSDLDNRLRETGAKVKLDPTLMVLHRRKMTLRYSVSYQIQAGKARRELGVSLGRTLLHSVFRLRPFVVYGYFKGIKASGRQEE